MSFTIRDTQIVKGMLERGDKQHDIAAYFGVNGGRVAEVSTGDNDYPNVQPTPEDTLPEPGPYVGLKSVREVQNILEDAISLIKEAGNISDEATLAIEALQKAQAKLK